MYSQNNEDTIISGYFGNFKGTLLDIGANDGETFSNSRMLIMKGWAGALVEPAPAAFAKLDALYKPNAETISVHNWAIANEIGMMKFQDMGAHLGNGDTSLLSTLLPEETKRWVGTPFTEIEVLAVTVKDFLAFCPHKVFEFVTIDAEGMDYEIMRQLPFDELQTRCICVEYNGKEQYKFDGVANNYRFKLLHKNGENLIYVR